MPGVRNYYFRSARFRLMVLCARSIDYVLLKRGTGGGQSLGPRSRRCAIRSAGHFAHLVTRPSDQDQRGCFCARDAARQAFPPWRAHPPPTACTMSSSVIPLSACPNSRSATERIGRTTSATIRIWLRADLRDMGDAQNILCRHTATLARKFIAAMRSPDAFEDAGVYR
jgi:hypothetical protein